MTYFIMSLVISIICGGDGISATDLLPLVALNHLNQKPVTTAGKPHIAIAGRERISAIASWLPLTEINQGWFSRRGRQDSPAHDRCYRLPK